MKKRKLLVYCYIFIATIVLGFVFYLPRKIIIKNIECESQYGNCSERVMVLLGNYVGQSLYESKKTINESLPSDVVRNTITFRYLYPSTLRIGVIETKPEFALGNMDKTDFRLVDTDGNVLSKVTGTSLPIVKIESDLPEVGTVLDENYIFALGLMRDLFRTYNLTEGVVTNNGLLVELPTKTNVLFPLEGDRDVLLGSFVLVINQLNTESSSSTMDKQVLVGKTVDLRFKNPVIR